MTTKSNFKVLIVVFTLLSIGMFSYNAVIPVKAYSTHSPIFIHNNAEFHSTAIAFSWEGDGLTAATAYIIEDYEITDDIYELIVIENTNVFFEIRNCFFDTVYGGSYDLDAIYLKNVQNGVIYNNTVKYSRHGIFVDEGCSNIVIDTNFINDTSQSGLRVNNSQSIKIINNTISNSVHHAIWINNTANSIINENNLTECYNGIWILGGSVGNNITSNKINGTTNGIWVTNSSVSNNVWYNDVNQSTFGIVIADQTTNTNIVNNTLYNCTEHGLSFDVTTSLNNATGNSFFNNNLEGLSQCIDNGTTNLIDYNYWNEWTSPDVDINGIVDIPYIIEGLSTNSDPHPLTASNQYVEHILTAAAIVSPMTSSFVNGSVTILWTAAYDTFDHDLLYNVSYRQNLASWIPINVEINETSVVWMTSESLDGTGYQIRVVSYCKYGLETETISGFFAIRHHSLTSPAFITSISGSVVSGIFTILWTPAEDDYPDHIVTYDIYYRHNLSSWIKIGDKITDPSFDWDTLTTHPGSGYQLRVIALCDHGLAQEIISGYFTIEHEPVREFPWIYIIAGIGLAAILGLSISLGVVSGKLRKTRTAKGIEPAPKPQSVKKPSAKPDSKSDLSKEKKSEIKTEEKTESTSKSTSKQQ